MEREGVWEAIPGEIEDRRCHVREIIIHPVGLQIQPKAEEARLSRHINEDDFRFAVRIMSRTVHRSAHQLCWLKVDDGDYRGKRKETHRWI